MRGRRAVVADDSVLHTAATVATTTEPGRAEPRHNRMPVAVYLLAFCLFAMGSAEFLVAGVLPAIADDLSVSLSAAGAVISAFAMGVVLGGPPLAVLTLRWPRRSTLIGSQLVFALAVAAGVMIDDYAVLLVTRFVSGVAYAAFFAVAAVTAVSLVDAERTARASGLVVSGLTLAMIVGGPASALLSHFIGWRGGFWLVIALTVLGAVLTRTVLPMSAPGPGARVRPELASMRRPQLWLVYLVTLLSTAAYMVVYNYLAAFLTEVTGLDGVWVPAVLTLFGVGAFAGIVVGGRLADQRPYRALFAGAGGILACAAVLAVAGRNPVVAVVFVALLGVAGFLLNPAIYGRVFTVAEHAPTLAGATAVSAFQLGISLVPAMAGAVVSSDDGLSAVPWIGVVLAAVAIPIIAGERRLSGTSQR